MRVEIVDRRGTDVRYFVYTDDGRELRQVHRDAWREVAEAKKKRVGLATVLADKESRNGH